MNEWVYQISRVRRAGVNNSFDEVVAHLKETYINLRTNKNWLGIAIPDDDYGGYNGAYVATLRGCCGIMHIFDFDAPFPKYYGNMWKMFEEAAYWGNYTYMMFTHTKVELINSALEFGFEDISNFENRRTTNRVRILMKKIRYS